ncbi:MAG TPA: hypothetical protein VF412_05170 [Bdellovibrio sp.]|uniref:hypothetical protein n=1 Tax=Bdellovibrio sp. TaxID=28201 RepID=UPI002F21E4A7
MADQTKHDAFHINDQLELSLEEIQERAIDIAATRAAENGWETYQLYQVGSPQRAGDSTRYDFDIVSAENSDEFSNESSESQPQLPASARRVAISRDIDL